VLKAAQPWVDVLSFQFFASPGEVAKSFTLFSDLTGKPTLLADASIPGSIPEQTQWGPRYSEMLQTLRELPCCIGWHVCGAYLKNRARGRGFLDEKDSINPEFARALRGANLETAEFVRRF